MTTRAVGALLRAEGAVVFVASTALFFALGGGLVMYLLLLLTPDVSMVGYLRDPRLGARVYNLVHTYVGPVGLLAIGYVGAPLWTLLGLIWVAHIGMDRMLGFGLKLPGDFAWTHLQAVETAPAREAP